MKKFDKATILLIAGAVVFIVIVAVVLFNVTAVRKAAVLNTSASSGTTITESMVKEIDVPKDTPGDFLSSKQQLINQRLTVRVEENQLIYASDLVSNIEWKNSGNDDFVTCSVEVSDDHAMGGLLVAGDRIDIGVIPSDEGAGVLSAAMPGTNIQSGQLSYVLANVTLMETTSALSSQQGSSLTTAITSTESSTKSSSKSSSYYMMSLSYNDYKKLKAAEANGELFFNLAPTQNEKKAPLLDKMKESINGELTDSAANPIKPKNTSTTNKISGSSDSSNNNDNNSNNNNNNDNNSDNNEENNEENNE